MARLILITIAAIIVVLGYIDTASDPCGNLFVAPAFCGVRDR